MYTNFSLLGALYRLRRDHSHQVDKLFPMLVVNFRFSELYGTPQCSADAREDLKKAIGTSAIGAFSLLGQTKYSEWICYEQTEAVVEYVVWYRREC